MIRVKNMVRAKELLKELDLIMDKTMECFSLDYCDLNREFDVYNKLCEARYATEEIINSRVKS